MKKIFIFVIVSCTAFSFVSAQESTPSGENGSSTANTIKKTTKEATHKVVETTKSAANKVEAAIDKPDPDARKVDVKVSERGVQMPSSLRAGKTAFMVKNVGKQAHNFEVRGSGLDKSFWIDLPPNETKTLQVDLKAGTYDAQCHVKGHEAEKKVHLTVK